LRRSKPDRDAEYELSVFINCPFDAAYRPLFDAIMFVVSACGLTPRSALEFPDASLLRFDKIVALIEQCRWGIHDISRVELAHQGLPRFNMPLELGLFLGARRFGNPGQRRKSCLVLDTDPFRYQSLISDIAGQDIASHGGEPARVVAAVRNWLSDSLPPREPSIPGGTDIARRCIRFQSELPALCAERRIQIYELTFKDYAGFVSRWLAGEDAGAA
jgi:hypothetical protein